MFISRSVSQQIFPKLTDVQLDWIESRWMFAGLWNLKERKRTCEVKI